MADTDIVVSLAGGAKLRAWRQSDAPSLTRYANNRNVSRNLRDLFPYPYAEEGARRWLGTHIGKSPITNFAIDLNGEAVGSIGLHLQNDVLRRTAEIGYWLAEPFWGRGIMTEAVRAAVGYGFETFDLARIEAYVSGQNAASARVLEKAGFDLEGRLRSRVTKDGETMDELMYAVVRG